MRIKIKHRCYQLSKIFKTTQVCMCVF